MKNLAILYEKPFDYAFVQNVTLCVGTCLSLHDLF